MQPRKIERRGCWSRGCGSSVPWMQSRGCKIERRMGRGCIAAGELQGRRAAKRPRPTFQPLRAHTARVIQKIPSSAASSLHASRASSLPAWGTPRMGCHESHEKGVSGACKVRRYGALRALGGPQASPHATTHGASDLVEMAPCTCHRTGAIGRLPSKRVPLPQVVGALGWC